MTVFRIVQEALTNALRHSNAPEAMVTLRYAPDRLGVVVEDNGRGMDQPSSTGHGLGGGPGFGRGVARVESWPSDRCSKVRGT